MSTLAPQKTRTGETLDLTAEVLGQALITGLNTFLDEYSLDPTDEVQGHVIAALTELLKHQLTRPQDGSVRTVAKISGVDVDFVAE